MKRRRTRTVGGRRVPHGVRLGIAHGSTWGPTLIELAGDRSDAVRYAVAANLYAPHFALGLLAKDKNRDIRCRVAMHPYCPPWLHEALADDGDALVRMAATTTVTR